ncbi:hypothetical protein QJS04_geneDACA012346 [Acorus gramineus]|uniref:Uncharacterized protein n=1 Tax=Acorus gramineus TaxID=55184 RepID=A0AAV9BAA4_ACOGR|nr:hypothetical protein QJS04_geneDACA012346 [Acorus gramineus]
MDDTFSIQISSSLVDKLVGVEQSKQKRKAKKVKPKVPEPPPQPKLKEPQPVPAVPTPPPGGWRFLPVVPPPPQTTSPEVDAIRSVLQESERVLEKLEKQEANMAHEVTQRAKELHDKEFKLPYQKPMPCLSEKDACLDCYKRHAKDPLKCASVVNAFSECAHKARQEVS